MNTHINSLLQTDRRSSLPKVTVACLVEERRRRLASAGPLAVQPMAPRPGSGHLHRTPATISPHGAHSLSPIHTGQTRPHVAAAAAGRLLTHPPAHTNSEAEGGQGAPGCYRQARFRDKPATHNHITHAEKLESTATKASLNSDVILRDAGSVEWQAGRAAGVQRHPWGSHSPSSDVTRQETGKHTGGRHSHIRESRPQA